jgi:hypothetical protein
VSGWTYRVDEDRDDDVRKYDHTAIRDGEVRDLDHSPYEVVSREAFAAYVATGFPPRPGRSAWKNATIIAHAAKVAGEST